MRRLRAYILAVLVGVMLCAGTQPARGTFTTFAYEGVVTSVIDHGYVWYPGLLDNGDLISGTVTLDLNTPDSAPEYDHKGIYNGAVVRLEGTVGDLTFSLSRRDTSIVEIRDNSPPSIAPTPWDSYGQACDVTIQAANGSGPIYEQRFVMSVLDWNGTALPGDELPPVMPPLSDFWDPQQIPQFGFSRAPAAIGGALTSWETIPEPATGVGMLVGVLALVLKRRSAARGE